MPRKIFISILGTGYYQKTRYSFPEVKHNSSKETNFVQESTLLQIGGDWNEDDKCFIFLTANARKDNWESPAQVNNKFVKEGKSLTYQGLEKVLKDNNFEFDIVDINIPDGNNEDEIWNIFENVYSIIEDGDELYFDVTHAFRSIPMLVIVLINYAKLLKSINVKSITYGNYMSAKDGFAPIDNLTSLSQLQDWTNAANLFINHGNLDALVSLTKQEITPILKESRGKDKTASILRKLSESMDSFSLAIKTNNAPDINNGQMFAEFKQYLNDLENELIKPLNPILEKVESKINKFSIAENVLNGLKAVDFCIESGLIQQGFTMLQESIISLVLDSEELEIKNIEYRSIVSGAFKIQKEEYGNDIEKWIGANYRNQFLTKQVLKNDIIISLASTFNALTDKRNIINHAGFNEKSSTKVFRKLEADLRDFNRRTKERLNIIGN